MPLSSERFSLDHARLLNTLKARDNLLFIQDLDGVCMGLVRDPLDRQIEPRYLQAAKQLDGHFFVLSNGEHIGRRGVNSIVDRTLGAAAARQQGCYLPGLGGGGVQWQDCYGAVSHPGVSDAELEFLAAVPGRCRDFMQQKLRAEPYQLSAAEIETLLASTVLDNLVSPTVNINNFFQKFAGQAETYRCLQRDLKNLMESLLAEASRQQLGSSFFVHYAPNLGSDASGERIKYAEGSDAGTTDFQFMLAGAVKETGVLVILNHYFQQRSGHYPLGADFSVRQAPRDQQQLLALLQQHFDPDLMPHIVAVGDTITSQPIELDGQQQVVRGGSDRGFLSFVQAIGGCVGVDNTIVYVDSSGGEVRRPGLKRDCLPASAERWGERHWLAVRGISDPADPLQVNFAFPGGHSQYVDFFCQLARDYSNGRRAATPPG